MNETVTLPLAVARLIRQVFLPANPRKMRTAHPDTIAAVEAYLAAWNAAELRERASSHAQPASPQK